MKKEKGIIEAILFAMGDSVEIPALAHALEIDEEEVKKLLDKMKKDYEKEDSGLRLMFLENSVQLATKGEYYDYLVKLVKAPKKQTLSESVIETLSIVAYKQPVTRGDVEKIRGVSSDYAISRLLEFDLIREVGRLDAPGKPLLFGTSEQFLRLFGLDSLENLPEISTVQLEEFKTEAQREAMGTVDTIEDPEDGLGDDQREGSDDYPGEDEDDGSGDGTGGSGDGSGGGLSDGSGDEGDGASGDGFRDGSGDSSGDDFDDDSEEVIVPI